MKPLAQPISLWVVHNGEEVCETVGWGQGSMLKMLFLSGMENCAVGPWCGVHLSVLAVNAGASPGPNRLLETMPDKLSFDKVSCLGEGGHEQH